MNERDDKIMVDLEEDHLRSERKKTLTGFITWPVFLVERETSWKKTEKHLNKKNF